MKGSVLAIGGLIIAVALPITFKCVRDGTDWLLGQVSINGESNNIIYVDGGGDIKNFNTTASMKKSGSNPYPYNTLETLCNEWAEAHPGYKVVVSRTSANGSRDTLLPQLQAKTAPSIIFQNGTNVNTDLNKGYYLDLTSYLDSTNPYTGEIWKNVYNENELASTQASNGKYYYVNLEKNPVCFVYNKTLLNRCGVTDLDSLSTYGGLLAAMRKVDEYKRNTGSNNIVVYDTEYQRYSIALESALYSTMLDEGDVLNPNGKISTEEMSRLYYYYSELGDSDYYDPRGSLFHRYIEMIHDLNLYIDSGSNPTPKWLSGELAFREATGKELAQIASTIDNIDFEWGIMPYPDVGADDISLDIKQVVRGTAGLTTSYWITNRAIQDGTAEMCVDLLMYLTAPEQNNRLIGDLKCGVPLNPTNPDEQMSQYVKPLYDIYNNDLVEQEAGNRVGFDSFNSWGIMGEAHKTAYIMAIHAMQGGYVPSGGGVSVEGTVDTIASSFIGAYESACISYNYDKTRW